MDAALWSGSEKAGIWPVLLAPDGAASPMIPEGMPVVKELDHTALMIRQRLKGGGTFTIICRESGLTAAGEAGEDKPLAWAWDMVGGAGQQAVVQTVTLNRVSYRYFGVNYQIRTAIGTGSCQQLSNGDIRLTPDNYGKLALGLYQ
jgi:hypothetical protein